MPNDIDVAVIGAGTSGVAAARLLAAEGRAGLTWRLFGTSERPADIAAEHYERRAVTSVLAMGSSFSILRGNDLVEATLVIVATGREQIPAFPGEARLRGRGVSYCAACDGDLFRGRRIAAVVTADSSIHELEHLRARAADVVVFAHDDVDLPGGVVRTISPLAEIVGERVVTRIRLVDGSEEEVAAVFVLKAELAPEVLVPGIALAADGTVVADEHGRTNLAGCLAAGTVTGAAPAAGETHGDRAARTALRLLAERSASHA